MAETKTELGGGKSWGRRDHVIWSCKEYWQFRLNGFLCNLCCLYMICAKYTLWKPTSRRDLYTYPRLSEVSYSDLGTRQSRAMLPPSNKQFNNSADIRSPSFSSPFFLYIYGHPRRHEIKAANVAAFRVSFPVIICRPSSLINYIFNNNVVLIKTSLEPTGTRIRLGNDNVDFFLCRLTYLREEYIESWDIYVPIYKWRLGIPRRYSHYSILKEKFILVTVSHRSYARVDKKIRIDLSKLKDRKSQGDSRL